MARAIARNDVSSSTNPVLDLLYLNSGALTDVEQLEFQVFDLSTGAAVQTYPVSGRQAVNVAGADHLSLGRYAAAWTVPNGEPLGRHRIVWFARRLIASPEQRFEEEFDVLVSGARWPGPAYALISDLRDEGFTTTALTDARAATLIRRASLMIERWTHRFFEPRILAPTITGYSAAALRLDIPIIAVSATSIDSVEVAADSYRVYNRHIAEGLLIPDDRIDPRIVFSGVFAAGLPSWFYSGAWTSLPRGVQLSGVFGYTDPDPLWPAGRTPELIRLATMMLVAKEQTLIADTATRIEDQLAGQVREVRTRDQSISYGGSSASGTYASGEFTGDARLDEIIVMFMAGPAIGSA